MVAKNCQILKKVIGKKWTRIIKFIVVQKKQKCG